MIRRIRLLLVVLVAVVLQTTLVPHFRIFGAVPDLCLLAVIGVAYENGPESGVKFGFCAGLVMDMFLSTAVGLSALSYAVTGYVIGAFRAGMLRTTSRTVPTVGGAGALIGGFVFLAFGALVGESGFLTMESVRVVALSALFDLLLAPAVIPLVQRTARRPAVETGWRIARR
jgi:rod shape-determining protein MreD